MLMIRTGKRSISTLVANVAMIAIVLSIAAVLVFWAQSSYGGFSSGSQVYFYEAEQGTQERFVSEKAFCTAT